MNSHLRNVFFGLSSVAIAASVSANPAHNRLSAMTESQRKDTLTTFMRSGGESCNVTKTFYQGSAKNGDAFWNVACSNGKSWVIQINNNSTGSTRLLECSALKAINAGECFKKF